MRRSGCLGDAPLLAPFDPRDRQITRGSRAYGGNSILVKLKPMRPRNGKLSSCLNELKIINHFGNKFKNKNIT